MNTWHITITHEVIFTNRIEVAAATEDEAIEKAKEMFVEQTDQSELVDVEVVDIVRVGDGAETSA